MENQIESAVTSFFNAWQSSSIGQMWQENERTYNAYTQQLQQQPLASPQQQPNSTSFPTRGAEVPRQAHQAHPLPHQPARSVSDSNILLTPSRSEISVTIQFSRDLGYSEQTATFMARLDLTAKQAVSFIQREMNFPESDVFSLYSRQQERWLEDHELFRDLTFLHSNAAELWYVNKLNVYKHTIEQQQEKISQLTQRLEFAQQQRNQSRTPSLARSPMTPVTHQDLPKENEELRVKLEEVEEENKRLKGEDVASLTYDELREVLDIHKEAQKKIEAAVFAEYQQMMCTVCMDEKKNTVILPCSHMCVCHSCATRQLDKCPLCKAGIQSFMKVHL